METEKIMQYKGYWDYTPVIWRVTLSLLGHLKSKIDHYYVNMVYNYQPCYWLYWLGLQKDLELLLPKIIN